MAEEIAPPTTTTGTTESLGSAQPPQNHPSVWHRPLPLPYAFTQTDSQMADGEAEVRGPSTTRSVPLSVQIPDEIEEDDQPSALFPGVSGIRPKVAAAKWVKQEELGLQKMYTSVTGQHSIPRPKARPLKPPKRFRPVPHWQSVTMLSIVLVLSALSCIGLLKLGISGVSLLHPGVTATPIPTRITSPTRTPHQKK